MENFRKMSNTTEAFMFELLRFFMRPYRMEWDMNGRSSYLEGRCNVALETVAHHHQFLRQHAQLTAKSAISFRFLVAHDAHHIKIWCSFFYYLYSFYRSSSIYRWRKYCIRGCFGSRNRCFGKNKCKICRCSKWW